MAVSHLPGAGFPELIVLLLNGERVPEGLGQYQLGVSMMKSLQIIHGPAVPA